VHRRRAAYKSLMPEGEGHEAQPDKGEQHNHETGDLAAGDAGAACMTGQTNPPAPDRGRANRPPPAG